MDRAMDQGYDSFQVIVKTKACFVNLNVDPQDDSQDPSGQDRRSAGRNFSSQEFIYHAQPDTQHSSALQRFQFSLTFPTVSCSEETPHTVHKWSIYEIYDFSNCFNKGCIVILKALRKLEIENSRLDVSALVMTLCSWLVFFGNCWHLKLNYSRKVNLIELLIFKWKSP